MGVRNLLRPRSIRDKLLLVLTGLVVLVSLFISIYLPRKLKAQAMNATLDKIADMTEMLAYNLKPVMASNDKKIMEQIFLGAQQDKDLLYMRVLDRSGRPVKDHNPNHEDIAESGDEEGKPFISADGTTVHLTKTISQNGQALGKIFLGYSIQDLRADLARTRREVAYISVAVLLFGVLIAFALSVLVSNPLKHLYETVEHISRGDLRRRARLFTDDEVGHLARSFNVMVDKVEKAQRDLEFMNIDLEKRVSGRTQDLQKEINERKQVEKELMLEKERAEGSSRSKSEFLANMSHELRTPLNAIIGFAQVLGDRYFGELNRKQTEYIKDIQTSGEHLLGLINDILDIAKIEAGRMDLDLSSVSLRDLLEHSFIMIKERCTKHRISLNLRVEDSVNGLEIQADIRKLKQVLYNLLSNASKFTPDGGFIALEADREKDKVIISVSDTGIGIAPEHIKKIFEEFYQVHGGTRDKTPGTGLGLSLSRKIVEMHGGRIWAESQGQGKGSRFSFELPIKGKPA